MNKKRIKWKEVKDLFLPGWTCQQCHGEGKYITQVDYWDTTRYPTVFCDCVLGQKLKRESNETT